MKWYEYVALFIGTGLFGTIIQLLITNRLSFKISKMEKQKEVYNDFLQQLQEVSSPSNINNTFNLIISRNRALLYASTTTAIAINNYVNMLVESQKIVRPMEEHDSNFTSIIHSMRKDLGLGKNERIPNIHFIVAQHKINP